MFPINTILAWNINIILNKKYDNNNIIIASRAYFLQSPTCTRVNNLVNTCAFNTYGLPVLFTRVACGKPYLRVWHFQVRLYLHIFCVITYYSSWHEMVLYKLGLLVRPFVSWPRLCCHYCHTIELHGTSTVRTTPSSLATSKVIIYLTLRCSVHHNVNIGTHPSYDETFFHLIVPPYNSKQIA
jgi:hypothetical protein